MYSIRLKIEHKMDMSGIEPDPSRMLSERDNQLHHMPLKGLRLRVISKRLRPFIST